MTGKELMPVTMTCQVFLPVTDRYPLGVDVAELARQIEHKVAPAPLIAVQGLANTFAFEPGEERLLDPAAARRWLIESDLAAPEVEVGERELERLVECREIIRDLIDANLDGDPQVAAPKLARLAAAHPVDLVAGADGKLTLDLTPPPTVDGVISQMVGIVFAAQLESQWSRLKICASDECRWAFYDGSRNRSGTWCQMETCGNQIKNRAYRRRKSTVKE
jgi:predicted RNA-binding Zn ribbon-like protein